MRRPPHRSLRREARSVSHANTRSHGDRIGIVSTAGVGRILIPSAYSSGADYNIGSTFVCCECNQRIEKEKLWLVQRCANTDYKNTHDWSHILVSVPDQDMDGKSDGKSGSSTRDPLAHLEEKLDKQSADLTRLEEKLDRQSAAFTLRLETLENILEQLLSAQRA